MAVAIASYAVYMYMDVVRRIPSRNFQMYDVSISESSIVMQKISCSYTEREQSNLTMTLNILSKSERITAIVTMSS